jgi:hypothetical protein
MKKFFVLVTMLCLSAQATAAVVHTSKLVGQIQSTSKSQDCYWFTLQGVSVADPSVVTDNIAWFAIPRTQYGAKDTLALLLAAKASGTSVSVATPGGVVCGRTEVLYVIAD